MDRKSITTILFSSFQSFCFSFSWPPAPPARISSTPRVTLRLPPSPVLYPSVRDYHCRAPARPRNLGGRGRRGRGRHRRRQARVGACRPPPLARLADRGLARRGEPHRGFPRPGGQKLSPGPPYRRPATRYGPARPCRCPIRALAAGDIDGDGAAEVVTLEAEYTDHPRRPARRIDVWRWDVFGFVLIHRSGQARFRELHLYDQDTDGILDIIIR